MSTNAQLNAMFRNFSNDPAMSKPAKAKATVTSISKNIASKFTRTFRGTVAGVEYTDPDLFTEAAKTWRGPNTEARKERGAAPVRGENESLIKSTMRGWKTPGRKAWVEPAGREIGAEVVIYEMYVDGGEVKAQVWSEAPDGGVWLATEDQHFIWAHKKSGVVNNSGSIGMPTTEDYVRCKSAA